MPDDDYGPFQQPDDGYLTQGQQPGAGYGQQQSPASPYAAGAPGGGVGSGAQPTKTYNLPDPETAWSSNLARYPRVSTLPLYVNDKASPKHDQVLQQLIANCYLAATLAAMANTAAGRQRITKMITAQKGAITTICKKYDMQSVGAEERINSNRWFTVAFKAGNVDVSDVLYHDNSDRDPHLRYMTTPKVDKALWGAIIEVAYASLKGSYDKISASKSGGTTLNQFLEDFLAMEWSILDPSSDKIKPACKNADKRAAFIATKIAGTKILTAWHGFAVLGMSGATKVKLWDPLKGKGQQIEFKDLLTEVQAVVVEAPEKTTKAP